MTIQILSPATSVAWSPPLALAKGARIELVLVRGDGETLPAAGYVDVQFARESGDWATVAGLSANVPRLLVEGPVSMRVGRRGETSAPLGVEYLDLAAAGGGGSTGGATEATLSTRASEATLAALSAKTPALVSGRQPVDGSGVTQPVSAAALPLPTGAATDATLQDVRARVGAGSATPDANPTVTSGSLITAIKGLWAWMLTTVATDATVALVKAAVDSVAARLPALLGPQAHTGSLSVTPAQSGTATVSAVATGTANVLLRGATTARKSLTVYNDSTSVLYLLLGTGAASSTSYSMALQPTDTLFIGWGEYQGAVNGILAGGSGTARVTEVT